MAFDSVATMERIRRYPRYIQESMIEARSNMILTLPS